MAGESTNNKSNGPTVGDLIWVGVTGVSLGYLVGLSVSPVVEIVITAVVGVAAGVIAWRKVTGFRSSTDSSQSRSFSGIE